MGFCCAFLLASAQHVEKCGAKTILLNQRGIFFGFPSFNFVLLGQKKPFCWAKPTCFDFSLSNFSIDGWATQWAPVELKKLCTSDTHHEREVTITKCDSFKGVAIQKVIVRRSLIHARLISRFLWDWSGDFHFSRCQWDRIKIERKLPQTFRHIACTFGFLVAELCVFKVEGKLVGNIDETDLPFPPSHSDPYRSLHLYQCRPR